MSDLSIVVEQAAAEDWPLPPEPEKLLAIYQTARNIRLEREKYAKEMERYEKLAKAAFINAVPKDSAGVVINSGNDKYVGLPVNKAVPIISDSEKVFAWVAANNRFDMLQKRLSDSAVKDYAEQTGTLPDGVEWFNSVDLSLRKV